MESDADSSTEPKDKNKKQKLAKPDPIKWNRKKTVNVRQACNLHAESLHEFPENCTPLEVFHKVNNMPDLVKIIVEQSHLYFQQRGRNVVTNDDEMKAFIGINYFMAINDLPSTYLYWDCSEFIGNEGIRNTIARTRFKEILQNLHFADNTQENNSEKAFKIRPIIDHFNKAFLSAMSDSNEQSIDEHMTKFKGRSGMKQYLQLKPIKWGFKSWYRCASKTGYLYEFDLYLGKKKDGVQYNLGESVILQLSEKLKNTFCTLFFDNFFNSPILVEKLFDDDIYAVGTVRSNRKQMPQMKIDKSMKRGDVDFQYSSKVICCKWFDNRGVMLLASNLQGMDECSNVSRRLKGSANKIAVNCPNIVKLYNNSMGGVDLMDQKTAAYRLGRKSKFRFYLRIFFDLLDVALVNAFIVFQSLRPTSLSLLDYKLIVAKGLIGLYCSRKRAFPESRPSKRRSLSQVSPADLPTHLPEFEASHKRCFYCKNEGKENKTYVQCGICGVSLCLVKEGNCFLKHHTSV